MTQEARPGTALDRIAADALAAIVEASDDAIYSKDRAAVLTSWNAAAARLYGYSEEEAIGRSVAMLIPPERQGEERRILDLVLRGERIKHYETERMAKDGRRILVSISVSPVHDSGGSIVGAAIISRDLTEQMALRAALEQNQIRQASVARRRALELNDEVVQGLAAAKMAVESNAYEEGLSAITATLERAKGIVTRLLDERFLDGPVEPGDLVRDDSPTPPPQ